jgi:hypothetical protein
MAQQAESSDICSSGGPVPVHQLSRLPNITKQQQQVLTYCKFF